MCGGLRALGKFSFVSPKLFQNEKLEKKKLRVFFFQFFTSSKEPFLVFYHKSVLSPGTLKCSSRFFFVLVLVFDQREDPP